MYVHDYLCIDEIPLECIRECSRPGPADDAVSKWIKKLDFSVHVEHARRHIEGMGVSDVESMTDLALAEFILWDACCNFQDHLDSVRDNPGMDFRDLPHGTDIICLQDY